MLFLLASAALPRCLCLCVSHVARPTSYVPVFRQLVAGKASSGEPLLELSGPLAARRGQAFRVGIRDAVDRCLSFLGHRKVDQRLAQRSWRLRENDWQAEQRSGKSDHNRNSRKHQQRATTRRTTKRYHQPQEEETAKNQTTKLTQRVDG